MRQLKIATGITNRDDSSTEKYLREISKVDLITSPEEEIALNLKIKQGDKKAFDKLVEANLRFVVSVAKQYQNQGLSLPDLINEGNLGLIKAAGRFDETKGFKFISYAVWWIRQSILQALAEQGRLVRMPQNRISIYNKASKAYNAFEQEHEREPSTEEVAELMEMDEHEIQNIFQSNTRHTSLDAPVHEDEDINMIDTLDAGECTDNDVINNSLKDEIRRYLGYLSPRESEIVTAYFRLDGDSGITIEQLEQKYDLHRERVRQIRLRAIKRLQRMEAKNQLLRTYLG
jgi:RNA polymerase primary sigma factor